MLRYTNKAAFDLIFVAELEQNALRALISDRSTFTISGSQVSVINSHACHFDLSHKD